MTKVYIVRHGQTIFNQLNKLQGWCDSPLTKQGIQDAHAVGKRLAHVHFDKFLCSDTTRAENTVKIIRNENLMSTDDSITPMSELREAFFGYFEGLDNDSSWRAIAGPHGFKNQRQILQAHDISTARDWMHEADPYHLAEDGKTFWARVDQGFEKIGSTGTQNILAVSHGTFIRSLVMRFAPQIDTFSNYPENGSYTVLEFKDSTWHVTAYNISE